MTAFPEPFASLFIVAIGLVLGSFLNVCIHRLPRDRSLVSPGSRCPACERPIRWHENIPVLSWVLLRGRCAGCSARISIRYPFVELLSAAMLLGLWLTFGPGWAFAISAVFALSLTVLFFTDLDLQLLPNAITLPGFVAGVAFAWVNPFLGEGELRRIWMSLAGAALGSGLLWGVGAIWQRLRGVEAMGFGDVKMMAMVGAFTGPTGVLFTIFAASVVGAVFGLAMVPLRGRSLQDSVPFGCFLAPAAMAALLFARRALEAYLDLFLVSPL